MNAMTRLLCFVLLIAPPAMAGDLVRRDAGDVIVENNHYRLTVDPARGATATSFIVKPSGDEMLLPDATHGVGLFGDVFRDEGFAGPWRGAYEVTIDAPGQVTFRRREGQVTVSRTLGATAGSPVIDVTQTITMHEGEDRHFPFRYWVHNRIGRPQGTTRYFLPALGGIETFTYAPGEMGSSQQHTVSAPPRPWLAAMADAPGGAGLGIRFEQTPPQTYYSYAKMSIITLEWGHDQYILRRGNSWTACYSLLAFAGLPHVDGVTRTVAGAVVLDDPGALRGRVMLAGELGERDVTLSYCRLPERNWQTIAAQTATVPGEVVFDVPDAGEGSFIVRAQMDDGQWERAITIGEPSGRYALMPLVRNTDQLGPATRDGAIPLQADTPIRVTKVLPTDCRLVRAFTHAPIDGRTDTRNSEGGVSEWRGIHGLPAVNYREYNDNDGLHVTLPEGGFDTMILRGQWTGDMHGDGDVLCNIPVHPDAFRLNIERDKSPRSISFFCGKKQVGPLADLTFARIDPVDDWTQPALRLGESTRVGDRLHEAMEQRFGPFYRVHQLGDAQGPAIQLDRGEFIHMVSPLQTPSSGIGAIDVQLHISDVEPGALLTLRVQDPLDPRREVMSVDFTVAGRGVYRVRMDVPDQVFLPATIESRLERPIAPAPRVWLSLACDAPAAIAETRVALHAMPREVAIHEAGAWRRMLLKGLFSAMSEPRPWMHLNDKAPIREQIATSAAIERYRTSLTEVLETAEIAWALLPDDDIVRQYHEWVYQNIDRRKPLPPPQVSDDDAPRWAKLVRQSYIELRDIAQWWLDHRMTEGGYFGGGINDDTDLFQTWQCLPLIESDPLGARLKDAAAQLADSAWRLTLEEGINRRSMDALHAYEEGVNQLALCARWFYGDPVHFERLMISAHSTMKLMIETPDGRVHFGGHILGIDQARNGFDHLGSAGGYATKLFLHPLYEVAWYNRNPAVLRRFEQWGRTWHDYQKPGAYAEYVDIKTGKPIQTTEAARTPTDEWLALYQVTGDRSWFDPLVLSMQSKSYRGFGPSYGRSAQALVTWDDEHQSQLRESYNGPGAGYAGFALNQDRELLMHWLEDSASWFGRYRHMHTAAEQRTDRVLTYNASTPLACYLGDAPNRNRWINYTAVSYEGLRGEDFAALVWKAGDDQLRVAIYNFTDRPLQGAMRTWRLDHGVYHITTGLDRDDDGAMDQPSAEDTATLMRGSTLPLNLAPRQVTIINVNQTQPLDDILTRADLALSSREIVIDGDTVRGTVHNIGAAPAEAIVVALDEGGNVLARQTLGVIEPPLDLKPRRIDFTLDAPGCVRVVVDHDQRVAEIYEDNNTVRSDR